MHKIDEIITTKWSEIYEVLDLFWLPFDVLTQKLESIFASYFSVQFYQINVTGTPDLLYCIISTPDEIYIFSRHNNILSHPIINELNSLNADFKVVKFKEPNGLLLFSSNNIQITKRLQIPNLLLTSLFHSEVYPTARFNLSLASLASFVRFKHNASVKIIDCQFDYKLIDIYDYIIVNKPDIVGISVNFGQIDLLQDFLNWSKKLKYNPVIILGNILPAISYKEILLDYPEIIISYSYGENSLLQLTSKYKNRDSWHEIPGVYFFDKTTQSIIKTKNDEIGSSKLQLPALDTINELNTKDGAITAEFSRGCHYSNCSFCTRVHKGIKWSSISSTQMLNYWKMFDNLFLKTNQAPYIFMSDEDFIGNDNSEFKLFLNHLDEQKLKIKFDTSCRTDQIFNIKRNKDWHIERGYFFRNCKEHGLSRLFIGVESGSNSQLERYKKGTTVDANISAIRYLSLLGIELRFGFILFDPLMSKHDLEENIAFLNRKDIVLNPQINWTIEQIYEYVFFYHGKTIDFENSSYVFERVSYMVSPLEVLKTSSYFEGLVLNHSCLIKNIDINFARVTTKYIVKEIELIKNASQLWVNFCFPIIYTLKGIAKVSEGELRVRLNNIIKKHRELSFLLLRSLCAAFKLFSNSIFTKWEKDLLTPIDLKEVIKNNIIDLGNDINEKSIDNILLFFEQRMKFEISIFNTRSNSLPLAKKTIWSETYEKWIETSILMSNIIREK